MQTSSTCSAATVSKTASPSHLILSHVKKKSLFLGYRIQGDVGPPGDPGRPLVNGVVEFVGIPKADKGTQVCEENKVVRIDNRCHPFIHQRLPQILFYNFLPFNDWSSHLTFRRGGGRPACVLCIPYSTLWWILRVVFIKVYIGWWFRSRVKWFYRCVRNWQIGLDQKENFDILSESGTQIQSKTSKFIRKST